MHFALEIVGLHTKFHWSFNTNDQISLHIALCYSEKRIRKNAQSSHFTEWLVCWSVHRVTNYAKFQVPITKDVGYRRLAGIH